MSQEPPEQPTDEAAEQPVVRRTPRPGGNRERSPEPPPSRPAAATPRPGGSRERAPEPPSAAPDEETPAPRPQRVRRPAAEQPSPEATTPLTPRQQRPQPEDEEPQGVATVPLAPRVRRQRPAETAAEAPAEEAPIAAPPRRPQRPAAERPAAQPVRQRPPAQRPPARPAAQARTTSGADMMPLVLSGVVGALLLALLAVFALSNNPLGSPSTGNILRIATPTLLVIEVGQPTATPGTSSEAEPPRIALDEFKQLYDDPAQRPLIVDVRATENYSEGHIAGAISVPEAQVAELLNLLPKEKMIVLYCQ